MKLTANIGDLLEASAQAASTVDKMTQMPIGNVYLRASKGAGTGSSGKLHLYSTDQFTETLIKIPGQVEEESELLFDPALMQAGLVGRPKDEDVQLTTVDTRLRVQHKRSKFHLSIPVGVKHMAERIKSIPFKDKPSFSLKASDLGECCRRTMFCIPTGGKTAQDRALGGLYLVSGQDSWGAYASDGSIAVATEGVNKGARAGSRMIIPGRSLPVVNKLMGRRGEDIVEVIQPSPEAPVFFRSGDLMLGCRTLAGHLENVREAVTSIKPAYSIQIPRQELKSSLERAVAFSSPRSYSILLDIKKEGLTISTRGDLAENDDIVDIEHQGEFNQPIRICVNRDYLVNIVSVCRDEVITMGIRGSLEPLTIEEGSVEKIKTRYVIMPVRI